MLVRYRYRIDPTSAQRQALARAFECARVAYNDAVAQRRRAFQAGEPISDTEVQRRVVTLAKQTPERAWLAGVASVVLVQACQDARRADRNWFDSVSGTRLGRRVERPRFRTKHGRQSIRLTRNGFAVRGSRLYVAKVGQVRVRWSRELPSVPSSVTVIREPDGRYYASFVVERDPTPLAPVPRAAGIDLGLVWFAVVAASDGTIQTDHPDPGQPAAPAGRGAAPGPRPTRSLPQAEGVQEQGERAPSGRGRPPEGPRPAGRPSSQAGFAADPREPSGRRGGPRGGGVGPDAAGQECP
jgi:putative transposase